MNTIIDNAYVRMWLEDGILFNIYKPNLIINLEIARQLVQERIKISNGISYPMLIDMSNLVSSDMETRKYLSGPEASYLVTAGALLMTNPIAMFAGNIFIRINKPKAPAKMFTNKQEALKWLQKYKSV